MFVRESLSQVPLHVRVFYSVARGVYSFAGSICIYLSPSAEDGERSSTATQQATRDTLSCIAKKYFVICIRFALLLMLPQMSGGGKQVGTLACSLARSLSLSLPARSLFSCYSDRIERTWPGWFEFIEKVQI